MWTAFAVFVIPSFALTARADSVQLPYRDLGTAGTAFADSVAPHISPDTLTAVRLGVLAPLTDPDGIAVLEGVSIALDEANARGGYHGLPYAVVARTTEGPWGITSRQGAALAYDDNVWAIIGGLDGQQAHLAELIAAKAWIPVITPWASDLTIDYANVPWVFRTAPDDGSQARLLWRYALGRGLSRIVVAVEGTREGFVAQQRLLDAARASHHPPALVLQYGPTAPEGQVPRIMNSGPEALVVWGPQGGALRLIRALRQSGCGVLALLPAVCATPEVLTQGEELGELVVAAPYDLSGTDAELDRFARAYLAGTGHGPRPSAVMAYDVARMVVAAIEEGGLNRASIRGALARGEFSGLTGAYRFSTLGGALRTPVLLRPHEGRWVRAELPSRPDGP